MSSTSRFDVSERKGDDAEDDWYEQTFQSELSMITDIKSKSINTGCASPLYDEKLLSLEKRLEKISMERQALERRVLALDDLEALRASLDLNLPYSRSWDKDSEHPACFNCNLYFNFLYRRHHCRNCGHIFCYLCAPGSNNFAIPEIGYNTPVRHCLSCSSTKKNAVEFGRRKALIQMIERIRKAENLALKSPTASSVEHVLTLYRECIAFADKGTTAVLAASVVAFYYLPKIQDAMEKGSPSEARCMSMIEDVGAMEYDFVNDRFHLSIGQRTRLSQRL